MASDRHSGAYVDVLYSNSSFKRRLVLLRFIKEGIHYSKVPW